VWQRCNQGLNVVVASGLSLKILLGLSLIERDETKELWLLLLLLLAAAGVAGARSLQGHPEASADDVDKSWPIDSFFFFFKSMN